MMLHYRQNKRPLFSAGKVFRFTVLLLIAAVSAYAAEPKMTAFEFTHPPPAAHAEVDVEQWSRIVIVELYRPTFDGPALNAKDQAQVAAWAELYESVKDMDDDVKIDAVNRFVNRLALPATARPDGASDGWAAPQEFLDGESVDERAYAITKYYALLALGLPESRLSLVVAEDTLSKREHLLLVVLMPDTFYLLDNKHDELTPEMALDIYRTRYFVNADSSWRPVPKAPLDITNDDDGEKPDESYDTASAMPAYMTGQTLKLYVPTASQREELGRSGRYKGWERVLQLENDDPTFSGRMLKIDNAALRKDWAKLYETAVNADIHVKIKQVNVFFNKIPYLSDRENWALGDYWASPREFLTKGTGDCEDYAVAKYFALKALRVAPKNMMIVNVNDIKSRGYHAVLVVYVGSSFYVLDNASDHIYRNSSISLYQPYYYLSETFNWTHASGRPANR